jgi:hypothetical protein
MPGRGQPGGPPFDPHDRGQAPTTRIGIARAGNANKLGLIQGQMHDARTPGDDQRRIREEIGTVSRVARVSAPRGSGAKSVIKSNILRPKGEVETTVSEIEGGYGIPKPETGVRSR